MEHPLYELILTIIFSLLSFAADGMPPPLMKRGRQDKDDGDMDDSEEYTEDKRPKSAPTAAGVRMPASSFNSPASAIGSSLNHMFILAEAATSAHYQERRMSGTSSSSSSYDSTGDQEEDEG